MVRQICSSFSVDSGEEPAGTAPVWERCLIIELPQPWAPDIKQSRHFPEHLEGALDEAAEKRHGVHLLCVAPDLEYSLDGHRRVIFFFRPCRLFGSYERNEYLVPSGDVSALTEALVRDSAELKRFERFRQGISGMRDIMVCTHGNRDVCCAIKGFPIYRKLRHEYAKDVGGDIRVWRVSHIGGHRFAPNLIDMPQGRNWSRVHLDQLGPLVHHNRPASELGPYYRGWSALGSPYEQVAEHEVFMLEGWKWVDYAVGTRMLDTEKVGCLRRVRIDFTDETMGVRGAYEVTVEQRKSSLRAECLEPGEPFETPQYGVSKLIKIL